MHNYVWKDIGMKEQELEESFLESVCERDIEKRRCNKYFRMLVITIPGGLTPELPTLSIIVMEGGLDRGKLNRCGK